MTLVTAPAASGLPAVAPQGGPPPLARRLPAPQLAFRSLLLLKEPHLAPSLFEAPGLSAHPPPHVQTLTRASLQPSTAPAGTLQTASSRHRPIDEDDPLDPMQRHRAALAPPESLSFQAPCAMAQPLGGATSPASLVPGRAAASLEELLPTLVRRIAWSGDRQRGTVRLELGAGELAGGTLLVHAEDGRVRVHLDVPPGVDTAQWQRRIRDSLASRGVTADSVEVT